MTVLLEGLLDKQPHSSSGACVVLNNIIKLRGPALSDKVSPHLQSNTYTEGYLDEIDFVFIRYFLLLEFIHCWEWNLVDIVRTFGYNILSHSYIM